VEVAFRGYAIGEMRKEGEVSRREAAHTERWLQCEAEGRRLCGSPESIVGQEVVAE
jgi:hypothetical protein